MSDWTDELKEEVIEQYKEANPTAENSVEIVKQIAEDIGKTPNGVRMILSKAGVYISKGAGTSKGKSTESTGDKPKRVSKADAIEELSNLISTHGGEIDEEILSKLTGKAAVYFSSVITAVANNEG